MSAIIPSEATGDDDESGLSLLDLAISLAQSWKLLVAGPALVAITVYGITHLLPPTFTARTTLLPPQQQQSAAASALASLGALSGLAGGATRTPGDQYVALLRSTTVADRLIDEFKLINVYESKFRADARKELAQNVRIDLGKKDGLITIEVDDETAERAAALANRHVDELRRLTSSLALTEAQQRRAFFEAQLLQNRKKLTEAQIDLQASGFSAGALRAEPKAAAEGYARIKAEVTGAEVRLQTLRRSLTDTAPEVQQQLTMLGALRGQLSQLEATDSSVTSPGYITKYREFKYQESLFEMFSRQYEMARLDESREGALIQIVDAAQPPERRSKPKRLLISLAAAVGSAFALIIFVLMRSAWRQAREQQYTASKLVQLRRALGRS